MNNIFLKGTSILSAASRYEMFCNLPLNNNFYFGAISTIGKFARIAPFHSCTVVCQSTDEEALEQPKRIYKTPVDWLPFQWHRRPMNNHFRDSGDLVQTLEYDPSWPKPDFEFSDELKTASDDIKHIFSLACASKAQIKEVIKRRTLERIQRHPNDLDSLEVKIALRTIQIRSLFDHAKACKKDILGGRIVLHMLINKRNRMLKHLRKMDTDRFNWLLKEMQLTFRPRKLGGPQEKYCKKWDLRRLTKEYCESTVKSKKAAYHEELKKQQIDFLKEKAETLAWIEKEEKELANLTL